MTEANDAKRNSDAHKSNVHERIAVEAATLSEAPEVSVRDADEFPALGPLLSSARAALERAIPARFDHEGKTYFLRASIGLARLMVFDSPTAFKPLAMSVSTSPNEFGHTPSL